LRRSIEENWACPFSLLRLGSCQLSRHKGQAGGGVTPPAAQPTQAEQCSSVQFASSRGLPLRALSLSPLPPPLPPPLTLWAPLLAVRSPHPPRCLSPWCLWVRVFERERAVMGPCIALAPTPQVPPPPQSSAWPSEGPATISLSLSASQESPWGARDGCLSIVLLSAGAELQLQQSRDTAEEQQQGRGT